MNLPFSTILFRFSVGLLCFQWVSSPLLSDDWQSNCQQIVAVVTEDWESARGRLCTLEKSGTQWVAVGTPIPVTVGKKGLGWGLGLHALDRAGPLKREGDKRAPAGLFRLESGFGTKLLVIRKFGYRRTTATDFWVDDPESLHYNRWVDTGSRNLTRDWSSAEVLRRPDNIYDYAIVVGHNRDSIIPGRGSAIFLHAWFGEGIATIGCTAMPMENVRSLLEWLDRAKRPVLAQVPAAELKYLNLPVETEFVLESLTKSTLR